ncbi:cell number regulator 7-like [Coffea eugenioides]|uniref:cell number regulator 7-like n=1 Tax=Coffea eugenioides TaxID=49369 RepID=UPI000F605271|nr:cell number regulator 7-like [Coffea eugenioides]
MASGNGNNDWSTGLCDCTEDCRSCCLACWCPCVAFGRIAEIVDRGQSSCCQMGCIFCLLGLLLLNHGSLSWIVSMGYRTKIRQQYGIMGGSCHDCILHFCCERCALCQEYRELQFQGYDVSAGWEANAAKKISGVTMAPVGEKMTR